MGSQRGRRNLATEPQQRFAHGEHPSWIPPAPPSALLSPPAHFIISLLLSNTSCFAAHRSRHGHQMLGQNSSAVWFSSPGSSGSEPRLTSVPVGTAHVSGDSTIRTCDQRFSTQSTCSRPGLPPATRVLKRRRDEHPDLKRGGRAGNTPGALRPSEKAAVLLRSTSPSWNVSAF